MSFDAEYLKLDMCHPDPELFFRIRESSSMKTPSKVEKVLGETVLPDAPADRPYLYGCMVLSFDGKMGFDNNPEGTLISKQNLYDPKGADLDFWILNVCRTYADAVIFGTGTLKARMQKLWYAQIHDPELIPARKELGKKTEVAASVFASIDGRDIPFAHPSFSMEPAPIIITSESGAAFISETMDRKCRIISEPENLTKEDEAVRLLVSGKEKAETGGLMRLLRKGGFEHVCVEAPGYIWTLMREGVLDEYFLNYSGVMAGGNTALGTWGPFTAESHPHAAIISAGVTKGFFFTRQELRYGLR